MSYERRLEIEALPAEEGWGRWQAVVGFGTTNVARKQLASVTLWIATTSGPQAVEAYRYQNWQFAKDGKLTDERWFSYTVWRGNTEYTDYSLKSRALYSLCAETREELCEKARQLLDADLRDLYKAVAIKESAREKFQ